MRELVSWDGGFGLAGYGFKDCIWDAIDGAGE